MSADLFIAANDDEIRQTFRRINSYTIPLNPEEQRHATHQGAFKWFIVEITEAYATTLKNLGVFTERNLSRMQDAKLLTEIVLACKEGIQTYSKRKLDKFYDEYENQFTEANSIRSKLDAAFERIISWDHIHNGGLMKPFNFYSLVLLLFHLVEPVPTLQATYQGGATGYGPDEIVLANLGKLESALEQDTSPPELRDFIDACSKATNTKKQREKRFVWFCRALEPRQIP